MTDVDSESWTCQGPCHGSMIGRRPADDRCPDCTPAAAGPFETERQASQTPAVRAVYAEFRADPGPGRMDAPNARMITAACDAAGVELGAYDRRIIAWLAGFEPQTCAVVAGMVTRAAVGLTLASAQLAVLGDALADAIEYRQPSGSCADCDSHPAALCEPHAGDLDQADAYAALARQLGLEEGL